MSLVVQQYTTLTYQSGVGWVDSTNAVVTNRRNNANNFAEFETDSFVTRVEWSVERLVGIGAFLNFESVLSRSRPSGQIIVTEWVIGEGSLSEQNGILFSGYSNVNIDIGKISGNGVGVAFLRSGDGSDLVAVDNLDDVPELNIFTFGGDDVVDLSALQSTSTSRVIINGGLGTDKLFLPGRPSDFGLFSVAGTTYSPPDGNATLSNSLLSFSITGIETIVFQRSNNRDPIASSDTVVASQNTDLTSVLVNGQTVPLAQFLLSNDSDLDGNTLSITGINVDPSAGIAVSFNNGNVVVSPKEDFVGNASFEYTISDGTATATTSVSVTVNPVAGIFRPGTNGQDRIIGGVGKDTLNGGNGDDLINGGRGADSLNGGNGNDTLIGGTGDNIVTGGRGNDVFVLAPGAGADTFTDFKPGTDKIGLSGGLNFFSLDLRDTNKIKTTGGELLATLEGVRASTLTASSFISYTG